MASAETLSREEFDLRLAKATEQMLEERHRLEVQNLQLQTPITDYTAALAQLEERVVGQTENAFTPNASHLKETLRQLAERSESVAAVLCFAPKPRIVVFPALLASMPVTTGCGYL